MGRLSQASYHASDLLHQPRSWPDPAPRGEDRARAWAQRALVTLETDPGGVWVAEDGTEIVGLVVSMVREGLWILSSFAVAPQAQGRGVGQQLLQAGLHHGRGALRGMFCSSDHPGAIRRYRAAGFDLHPQFAFRGVVDRSALPVAREMRDGTDRDLDLMDSVDRATRGAAHGRSHEVLLAQFPLRVVDRPTGQGYVYIGADGAPQLLAATSLRIARELMWESLAWAAPDRVTTVSHVNAANQWALDIGLAARLAVVTSGHLCLRGMKPPRQYLPHGSLL